MTMYYHVCKKELCPHCLQMSCNCEHTFENTTGGFKMLCPHCKGIMAQTTIITTDTLSEFATNLIQSQENIDPEIQKAVNEIYWDCL